MPARTAVEAGKIAATATTGWVAIEYLSAGVGLLIGLLSAATLFYQFRIKRREWRDGKRRNDPPDL